MRKNYKLGILVAAFILISSMESFAANSIKVMEVQDKGDNPIVFVKGYEGNVASASALVGNIECPKVSHQKISDGKVYLDTLILFDNSLSIPEETRDVAKAWISDIIADRKPYERFSIATYGEELESIIDFTDEYSDLKNAIAKIGYKDRDTYLTDVLYDLVSSDSFKENSDGAYRRIIVISDGVDNKNVGYTSDELISLLNESGMPVYTIGVYNKSQTNGKELSNMFSISRATNATSATYGTDEVGELLKSLKQDRDILCLEVSPEDAVKDGSLKTITITIEGDMGSQIATVDNVRMKQIAVSQKTDQVIEEKVEKTEVMTPQEKTTPKEDEKKILIYICCGIIGLVLAIILYIYARKKAAKKNEIIETEDPFKDMLEEEKTEIVFGSSAQDDEDATVYMFNQGRSYTVIFSDIYNPARIYQTTMQTKIVVGRSSKNQMVDLVIDYEPTISKVQCKIERKGDKFFLADMQSSNGTFLNDSKVLSEVEIYSGSVVKMGRAEMKIEIK